jgi:hypothetical protein
MRGKEPYVKLDFQEMNQKINFLKGDILYGNSSSAASARF